jgi:hypothetical protein
VKSAVDAVFEEQIRVFFQNLSVNLIITVCRRAARVNLIAGNVPVSVASAIVHDHRLVVFE